MYYSDIIKIMDFSFKKEITKELLLKYYNQETYLEHYLGIPVTKKLVVSPLRNDHTPTASFYKNKSGDIIFKDFNGSFSGNFINVVMFQNNCTYHQALKRIAIDFNIIKGENVPTRIKIVTKEFKDSGPSRIQITPQEFTKEELAWWKQYNITPSILKKFQVFSCKNVFLNGNFFASSTKANMVFGYYGNKKNKNELWRIYFPKRSEYRFISNWPASKIQGYTQLPKTGKVLVITKSLKDVMALASFNIPAIAPNSEHLFVSDTILADLKSRFTYIIVLYDLDSTGIRRTKEIRKAHPELITTLLPRTYYCKDFSDFVAKHGVNETKKMIKHFVKYCKNKYK